MNNIKNKIILLIISLTLVFVSIYLLNNTNNNVLIYNIIIILSALMLIITCVTILSNNGGTTNLKSRDRLFNSLIQNSDTIYLMYNVKSKKMVYMSKNIPEVLNIEQKENELDYLEIVKEIFDLPILKDQIRNWNEETELVTQMISFTNSKTLEKIWIKVKLYPQIEKKNHFIVILISNVNDEHEQQHLLVSQASDIKSREKQLNQITSSSYDIEMNINLLTNEFQLRNLKSDINYLGDNRTGNYEFEINNILKDYINEEDTNIIKENISIDNLKKVAENDGNEPTSVRYRIKNADEVTWLESTIFLTDNKGEEKITILTKNVTENAEYMRNQNQKLENALKEAKNANKSKDEFLTIMSHEIRTPLNAIIGLSESALTEELPRTVQEDIEGINSASKGVLQIIDGILDISKIETGDIKLIEKEYDTLKFFKNLESIAKKQLTNKNVEIELDVQNEIPEKLYGDSGKIKQILLNIINNAIKYTEKGKIQIIGNCNKTTSNTELIISIKDTGKGIESEKLSKLFNVNKKANNKDYIEGMGLTIAKNLIDLLKGEIEVESTVGEGSTFTIKINQKTISDSTIGDAKNFDPEKKKLNTFNAEGKKVLVVDDNKLNIRVAERLLKKYNIEIASVETGQECIDLINDKNKFDLILLDQMMPEMSGVETLKELKKIKGFNIPVVVLTADAIVGKKEEYIKEGFDDYLSKPIEIDKLTEILKKYFK